MNSFFRQLPAILFFAGASSSPAQFGITPLNSFGAGGWLAPNGYRASTYAYLTTGDTERGLAAANGHLYLVSRNGGDFVRILDAQTGQDLGALNLGSNTVTGGTFDVNMVAVGNDGAIYVGNLATGPAPFRIYRWADDLSGAVPTVAYSGVPLAGARVGDSLAAIGRGNSTRLAAGFNNTPNVGGNNGYAIIDPSAGTATAVGFNGSEPAAGDFRVAISFTDSAHVVGTPGGAGNALRYSAFSGSNGILVASSALASPDERALSFALVGGFSLLAAVSTADGHVSIYNLADGANPVLVGQANATSGTLAADAHNTGAVAWGNITGNQADLYAMATDMGIQAFVVTVPGPAPAVITNEPTSQTIEELFPVTFSVGATGNPAPSYQWYRGTSPIPAATNASYTIPRVALDDNAAGFSVVVQNPVGNSTFAVTSGVATLTVIADTNPPVLLGARALGLGQVLAAFSEWIAPATATNLASFSIQSTNGALVISSAALDSSQTNILLGVSPMVVGVDYTLTVNNLRDQSAAGNLIAPGSQAHFTGNAYALAPLGAPALAGSQAAATNGYDISAGGAGIAGAADEANLSYQLQTGDFDYAVRLDSLGLADAWSEAGLMAREDLTAGARSASVLATPTISGTFFVSRSLTNGPAARAGSFPVNYPNTWLRLKRAGSVFTGFAGFDGRNWAQLGSVNLALGPTVYFGFVLSSHNTNQLTTAAFRDFGPVSGAGANPPPPIETLAQCSRRTSLVISEIMYHPGVTNSLQYVELFNSRGEMQDVSGYQLAGSISFTFPVGTVIPGGGFLVVAKSPADLESVYGLSGVLGPYSNSLPSSTGTVRLLNQAGGVFLEINYGTSPPWPVSPDGGGHSLVLARPSYGEDNPLAWAASDSVGGSPGKLEPAASDPLREVVMNEFLAHSVPPLLGFIELFNRSTGLLDLSGCSLSDDPATNKFVVPPGTTLGPRGYLSYDESRLGFTLNPSGGTLYLRNASGTRVLDAVRYEAQLNGVSSGRVPDGAPAVRPLAARTPGRANSAFWQGPIVINEIMYDPISLDDDDQYVELYNRGAQVVDLSGWQFVSGIGYTFEPGTAIPPGGYLVVGRNRSRLLANYPNLNSSNLVGNFTGALSHKGERLVLAMPDLEVTANGQGGFTTNTIYPIENEVTYNTGGRWGQWSHGGGSSLELIDPRADNSLAPNWADSDETRKAPWTMLSATGTLDNGNVAADELQVLLQGVGECLVDDLQVLDSGGNNLIPNSTLESGASGWTAEGTEQTSGLETSEGHNSSRSYHLRAVEKGDNQVNRVRVPLSKGLAAGATNVTIRGAARWLKGDPEVVFRLRGNWLDCAGELTCPSNLGTPGAPNSRYVSNAPPAISGAQHAPILPVANQPIVVTARVSDPDGISALTLNYRVDPNASYSAVAMADDGTRGDLAAGDGIYTATIPGQAAGAMIAFYVQATDGFAVPATGTFPNDAPARECLIRVGEVQPTGNYPVYRLWMTQAKMNAWNTASRLNNTSYDVTFVLGNERVIYNAQARFKGSPYISPGYCGVACGRCGYTLAFPQDDLFLGDVEVVLDWPGGHGGETTALQEQMCYWIADRLNLPFSHRYTIRLHINGVTDDARQATFEAVVQPDASFVKEWSPNDSGGELFKIERAFEFTDADGLVADPEPRLQLYTTTGGVKKREKYRWTWLFRATDRRDDYTNIFALVDAVNAAAPEPYTSATMGLVDMEEWMGAFATEHIIENFDAYGHEIGKNMYAYQPVNGKWQLYLFDLDWAMLAAPRYNSIYAASSGPLFNADDPTITRMYAFPPFARAYWRAVQDAVEGPFDPANCDPVIDAKSRSLFANGILWCDGQPLTGAGGVKTWFSQRRAFLQSQLATVAAPFAASLVQVSNNVARITGTAPVGVRTVWFNGAEWPLVWTSVTAWTASVPLEPGTNLLSVVGVDTQARPVSGASTSVTAAYAGAPVSPAGQVLINEIMYHPQPPDPGYLELYNNSGNLAFDLSGWEFSGLGYTFPAGSLLPPRGYLVLTPNRGAFAAAYGATHPVFDTLSGALPTAGATLTLLRPGTNPVSERLVAGVSYRAAAPWPAEADGAGASLQLIDPDQDNWRVANWGVGSVTAGGSGPPPATPGAQNSVAATLPPFPPLWINEIQAENLSGITNSAGQHAPWLELYNPSTNPVPLAGLYLANNYINLAGWPFPTGAVMGPGEFKTIFADGQASLSTSHELHTDFIMAGDAGSVALSRLYNGQPQVLDYLDYSNLAPDHSFGSFPDGQAFVRQELVVATPGGPNAGNPAASFIAYRVPGSAYTQDFNSLPDPGPDSVNTANPVTINGITYALPNPFDFAAAPAASGQIGGLGLPALAGWFGLADPAASVGVRFGATDGDQTTGGVLSFGLPGSTNRALGLLATTTTGFTAFGARFLNASTDTLDHIRLQFTGQVWRQSDKAKNLTFYYFIDPSGSGAMSTNATGYLPGLDVAFPTVAADAGGIAVDGSSPQNQTALGVVDQPIAQWPPGAALWLVWEMTAPAGKAQGLAIDDLSFSAWSGAPTPPQLTGLSLSAGAVTFSWASILGRLYRVQYNDDLRTANWTTLGTDQTGTGGLLSLTLAISDAPQRFYRVQVR